MSKRERLSGGGMRAVWRGREYRMSGPTGIGPRGRYFLTALHPDDPRPEGAVYDERLGGYGIPIDPSELDAWYSTTWYFTWRGRDFRALSRSGDEVEGGLDGMDDRWARANGLTIMERGVAQGGFPISEVEDLHEERRDLLAEWKSKRAQAELKREHNQ